MNILKLLWCWMAHKEQWVVNEFDGLKACRCKACGLLVWDAESGEVLDDAIKTAAGQG